MPDALPGSDTALSLDLASAAPAVEAPPRRNRRVPIATFITDLNVGRRRPTRAWAIFVAVLLGVLYLSTTSGPAIFDQIEGLYAGAAREMLDRDYVANTAGQLWRGHWSVPTNDGIPRLQKPPLLYWLEMGSLRIFGPTEFGARLPIALACLLWFYAVFLLGRRLHGARVGATAALMLGTMAGVFIFGHMIMPEPLLAAFLTFTFWCFVNALQEPGHAARWFTLAWVFMALGSFSKGLHGAGYPLGVAAVLAWRFPASRVVWKKLFRPAGPLLFLAVVVPWYVAIEWRFPGFLRDQLFNEQVGHAINRRFPADSERVSLTAFWLQHLIFFFPWTLLVPAGLVHWWRRRRKEKEPVQGQALVTRQEPPLPRVAAAVPGVWLGLTAVSILFSALQDYYTMTAWGVVALWLAQPWAGERLAASQAPRWSRVFPGLALAVLGVLAAGAGWWLSARVPTTASDAALAANNTIGELDSILDTISAIPWESWRQLLPLLWGTAATLALLGVAAAILAWRRREWAAIPTIAVAAAILLVLSARGMGVMEDHLSLKRAAQAINRLAEPGSLVVCQGHPRDNPSAFFYLDRQLHWVDSSPVHEFASRELKIGNALFLTEAELARRWAIAGAPRVFLICEDRDLPRWQRELQLTTAQAKPVARSGARVVISNR